MASPLGALRSARVGFDSFAASGLVKGLVAALAIIPLLFGALCLWALIDPQEGLKEVPVAVVNEDTGAIIGGMQINVGDDVVSKLKGSDDGLQYNFVSAEDAKRGLKAGDYYMVLTVPKGFSRDIASAETADPTQAVLELECDEAANVLVAQTGQSVLEQLEAMLVQSVSKEYYNSVFLKVNNAADKAQSAADGASKLKVSLTDTVLGSTILSSTIAATAQGAAALPSGLYQIAGISQTMTEGAAASAVGATALSEISGTVATGAQELAANTEGLGVQTAALAAGVTGVDGILQVAVSVLGDTASGMTLIGGATQIHEGLVALRGDATAGTGLVGAQADAEDVADGLGGAIVTVDGLASDSNAVTTKIDDAIAALNDSTKTDTEKMDAAKAALAGTSEATGAQGLSDDLTANLRMLKGSSAGMNPGLVGLQADAQGVADDLGVAISMLDGNGTPANFGLIPATSVLQQGLIVLRNGYGDPTDPTTYIPGLVDAQAASAQVKTGTDALAAASPGLEKGVANLALGAAGVDTGVKGLASGSGALAMGLGAITQGVAAVAEGSGTLASTLGTAAAGSANLSTNITAAKDDSSSLATQLKDDASSIRSDSTDSSKRASAMADPITTEVSYYTKVKDYGTAFAPYFIALAMWIGAIVIAFVCTPISKRITASSVSPVTAAWSGFAPMAAIAAVQAVLLGLVLQLGLGLTVTNPLAYYLFTILVGLVFVAIAQLLSAAFGLLGKIAAVGLLALQLPGAAGVFPIEAAPGFFQATSPFMPLTYATAGLRECVSGLNMGHAGICALVLLAMGLVAFALTAFVAYRRRTVRMQDIHPLVQL